jgi:hypothetical protein
MNMSTSSSRSLTVALGIAAATTAVALAGQPQSSSAAGDRAAQQYTQLISRSLDGGTPNGPSGNAAISQDKRFARAIAFESEASNIVPGDNNGVKDVFVVRRDGKIDNTGAKWTPGTTSLVSRTFNGQRANGPSFAPAIDGGFTRPSRGKRRGKAGEDEAVAPNCVAFLSAATNIVQGDSNGHVDAYLSKISGGDPVRISPAAAGADASAVAVSGDCKKAASVVGGKLYVYDVGSGLIRARRTSGAASDPAFAVGRTNDLVFATPVGVYLSRNATAAPRLVARGGRNPAYNDLKRRVVAYEKGARGHSQVYFKDLGRAAKVASRLGSTFGNGDSRDPQVGNSGYAIAFESAASNLGVNALSRAGDTNGVSDVYLYTDVRKITLLESTKDKAVPLPTGGNDPAMSYYYNYILFDSAAPLGVPVGPEQVYMRYLGSV